MRVIVKVWASTHGRRGDRFELTWFRHVHSDGHDVWHQQPCSVDGRRHIVDPRIDYGSTAAQMFDRDVERCRQIAEHVDGVPGSGGLSVRGGS